MPPNGERAEGQDAACPWRFGAVSLFPAPSPRAAHPGALQAKLAVGVADDPLEREADRVADQVVPEPGYTLSAAPTRISRKCTTCQEELPRRSADVATPAAGEPAGLVQEVLRSPGRPLDHATRGYFEPRFGHDFSAVRLHTGASAERSARRVNADAYTVGPNIVFGAGKLATTTTAGRRLLAHELTHVVQQSGGSGRVEDARLQRQPTTGERICVPGLPADDPACAGQRAGGEPKKSDPGHSLPFGALSNPPAGVGLRVPVHPRAVSGFHGWSDDYAVPEGRANNANRFTVGDYRLQQICAIDEAGKSRVFVYYTTGGGATYAVGPDYLQAFVATHGGTITARSSNRDQLDLPTGMDPRTLPAAPGAFNEEPQITYMAPELPRYDRPEVEPTPFRVGIYLMRPYLRRLPNGQWAVLFYIAERQMTAFGGRFRPELVVGPKWLDFFSSRVDYYNGIAQLGFLTPGGESAPPEYVQRSARYLAGLLHSDPERAKEGLKAWQAAVKDPSWWFQVATATAGAAEPAPAVRPPSLRVLPGGGGTPARPTIGAAGEAGVVGQPTIGRPVAGGGGPALAVRPSVEPAPATPSPVTVPRTRPQPVPGWNPKPAPVAPRVSPPSPVATGAAVGAVGAASGKAPAGRPKPAPDPSEEEEKKRKFGFMRHQIQQGLHYHYASLAVTAANENGVTGRQLRDTMRKNFEQFMEIARGTRKVPDGWTRGPVRWERPIRSAIIAQSQAIPAIIAAGGVTLTGDVNALRRCFDPASGNPTTCESNDIRVDVENKGHNLRSEQ